MEICQNACLEDSNCFSLEFQDNKDNECKLCSETCSTELGGGSHHWCYVKTITTTIEPTTTTTSGNAFYKKKKKPWKQKKLQFVLGQLRPLDQFFVLVL